MHYPVLFNCMFSASTWCILVQSIQTAWECYPFPIAPYFQTFTNVSLIIVSGLQIYAPWQTVKEKQTNMPQSTSFSWWKNEFTMQIFQDNECGFVLHCSDRFTTVSHIFWSSLTPSKCIYLPESSRISPVSTCSNVLLSSTMSMSSVTALRPWRFAELNR